MGAPQLIVPGTASGTAPVGGTGNPNTIPRWTGPSTLGDSIISQDTNARAIGIGVTPSATWDTSYRAIQLGQTASAMAESAAAANWWTQNNGIWDGTNWKYTAAGAGAQYAQIGGEHRFSYVAAGAAGANFTWSRAVTIDISGNVGIGTASPAGKLDIADAASASVYISRPGLSAVYGAAGLGNLRWRDTANAFDAAQISAVGYFPGSNGQMTFSTAAGGTMIERMRIATNASQAASQVAIGTSSFTTGRALTTVADLDVFGLTVGRGASGVAGNTAFGAAALGSVTSASATVGVGFEALNALSTGAGNTAVGYRAVRAVTTSNSNTGIGYLAVANMTGASNTGLGQQALQGAVGASGGSNVGIGLQAGLALTTGANNVLVGSTAGDSVTTGSSNIVIGSGADVAAAGDSNQLVLGDATNYVATNGGATTYYATAGASLGYMRVRLNGTYVKIEVFADV